MKKIVIIGGHGGISATEFIEEIGEYEVLGFLNDVEKQDTMIGNYPVLDKLTNWHKLNKDCYFIFTIHHYYAMQKRHELLKSLQIPIERFANIIHPLAYISKSCKLGHGIIVYPFVKLHALSRIGNFCSIRSSANIGHDCNIGEFNYIGPNAVLSGYCQSEEGVYIAPNVTINPWLKLGKYSMIGSNSVIYKDVESCKLLQSMPPKILGNPADCQGK